MNALSDVFPPHLRYLRAPELPRPGPYPDEDATWAYSWPGGLRLAAALDAPSCQGRRIADLGCGRGVLGLTALLQGAAGVVFADRSATALAFVEAVLGGNGLAGRGACVAHLWGDPIPQGPFDLILGGDILYRPAFFARLLASLAASLAVDGRALLADPRLALDEELPGLAAEAGLTWCEVRREAGWGTLMEARRGGSGDGGGVPPAARRVADQAPPPLNA